MRYLVVLALLISVPAFAGRFGGSKSSSSGGSKSYSSGSKVSSSPSSSSGSGWSFWKKKPTTAPAPAPAPVAPPKPAPAPAPAKPAPRFNTMYASTPAPAPVTRVVHERVVVNNVRYVYPYNHDLFLYYAMFHSNQPTVIVQNNGANQQVPNPCYFLDKTKPCTKTEEMVCGELCRR